MKKVMILLAMTSLGIPSMAQTETTQQVPVLNEKHSEYIPVAQYWKEHNIFQHLDVSVSAGTTGIISSFVQVSIICRALPLR